MGCSVRSETHTLKTTVLWPFLFSITVSLLFSLCQERQAFENASFSAGLRGTGGGLLQGAGEEGVGAGQGPEQDTPSCKGSLMPLTVRGLDVFSQRDLSPQLYEHRGQLVPLRGQDAETPSLLVPSLILPLIQVRLLRSQAPRIMSFI